MEGRSKALPPSFEIGINITQDHVDLGSKAEGYTDGLAPPQCDTTGLEDTHRVHPDKTHQDITFPKDILHFAIQRRVCPPIKYAKSHLVTFGLSPHSEIKILDDGPDQGEQYHDDQDHRHQVDKAGHHLIGIIPTGQVLWPGSYPGPVPLEIENKARQRNLRSSQRSEGDFVASLL